MSKKSPVYAALLLAVVAGITIFAEEQGRDAIEINTRKIITEADGTRQTAEPKGLRSRVLFITKQGCANLDFQKMKIPQVKVPGTGEIFLD